MRERKGIAFRTDDKVREAIREVLPFHPTAAQKRTLGEIVGDMRAPNPMRRLLQGDVDPAKRSSRCRRAGCHRERLPGGADGSDGNSGDSALPCGAQAAGALSRKYKIVLLTGSLDEDRKRTNRGSIIRGEAQVVIGTHALIEEKVEFDNLGLVVVDEQHRFGVLQRFKLMKKPNRLNPMCW